MALYRTERRLNWHHRLHIGHWYAPWSQAQADTGADYFSRALRWLRSSYPKASITAGSHALPDVSTGWPQERFGLHPCDANAGGAHGTDTTAASDRNAATPTATDNAATPATTGNDATPHAGDLLIIEWPRAASDCPNADSIPQKNDAPPGAGNKAAAPSNQTPPLPPAANASAAAFLPPLWTNGLERALRRNWQDNPLTEVIFIGGTAEICEQGLALAAHYGITVLDPAARLRPESPTAPDHREALIPAGTTGACPPLPPQGQEVWAGMLISLLREQIRVGPTPDPVSLPAGLWWKPR